MRAICRVIKCGWRLSGILQGKKFLLSKFSVGPHFSKLVPYLGGKGDSRTTAPILPAGPHPACGPSFKNSEICSAIAGCRKRRVRRMFRRLLPPSPPAEKATARQDQAGQSSTSDGAGNSKHAQQTRILERESLPFCHVL